LTLLRVIVLAAIEPEAKSLLGREWKMMTGGHSWIPCVIAVQPLPAFAAAQRDVEAVK